MKKINKFSGLVLALLIIALIGCKNASSASSSDDTPAVTDNAVKYIPILGSDTIASASASVSTARTITIEDTTSANDPLGLKTTVSEISPVLTGFKANTDNQYKIGDTFTSTVLGVSVITTISESNGEVVYTGLFSDGMSYYKITIHSNMTFDFEQKLDLSEYVTIYAEGPGEPRTYYTIMSVASISAITFNATGEYDGTFVYKFIETTSDELTRWDFGAAKYEIRSNTNAWVMRLLECQNGGSRYTADGDFSLANSKLTDIFANGDTTPTNSLAAGTLCWMYYYFNSYWNGFIGWDDGSTSSFTFDDVNGVSQTMTKKDAADYIWANFK